MTLQHGSALADNGVPTTCHAQPEVAENAVSEMGIDSEACRSSLTKLRKLAVRLTFQHPLPGVSPYKTARFGRGSALRFEKTHEHLSTGLFLLARLRVLR